MLKRDVILSRTDSIWRFLTPHPTANGKVSASGNMTKACAIVAQVCLPGTTTGLWELSIITVWDRKKFQHTVSSLSHPPGNCLMMISWNLR